MFINRSQSVYVGHLGPVPLYLHWSFLILLYLVWPKGSGLDMQTILIWIMVIIGSIVLHELGHAMAARAQGMSGITITLWALGGLCDSRGDRLPFRQIIILVAGPAVSFLLYWGADIALDVLNQTHPDWLLTKAGSPNALALALYFCSWANLRLGIFNILPIFPMDGGQIVYNGLLLTTREATAKRIAMVIAVIGACAYVAWETNQAQGQFAIGAALFMAFLLINAYNYLR
jgi:Zn-dependent protease